MEKLRKMIQSTLAFLLWLQQLDGVTSFLLSQPKSATSLKISSTSGEGGGIFYDGPQHSYPNDIDQESGSSSASSFFVRKSSRNVQNKDVVVIGGGLAGLSAALHLSQLDPDRHITILERETDKTTTVASFAAAGMLAPQSERLPQGPLLDLCVASRKCYREFVDLVEGLASEAGEEGKQYLTYGDGTVGFVASGGFLAPAFAGDSVATWSPPDHSAKWLDATQIREMEPGLHPDVVGGWWFPEDASVDARRLTCALRAACVASGVELKIGKDFEVKSLDLLDGECKGLYLGNRKYMKTKSVLVANGSWMRQLLPIPVEPHKGQSLSLRMPTDRPPLLKRVLFAQDSYIVPKSDGRIVVGATVEAGSYDPNVTPAGIMHILHHAMQLVPGLGDLPIEETWVGLRPTTPDKGPILGKTEWSNLFLAGGYWRNGVLLAPKTGQMLAQVIAGQELSSSDQALLDAFSWDRFTTPEGSKQMEMNARFAASFYPVHRRAEGAGVAAAVGTELGSYSTARSAGGERAKDRASFFGDSNDSLENAARMGQEDAGAFSGYEKSSEPEKRSAPMLQEAKPISMLESSSVKSRERARDTVAFEGSADAYTIQGEELKDDLPSIYQSIQKKQESRDIEMGEGDDTDERPDPGFRMYHVDSETGEQMEIPPYTTLAEVEEMIEKRKSAQPQGDEGDSILDGYQAIEDATRTQDSVSMMRQARIRNRGESGSFGGEIDVDSLGIPHIQNGVKVDASNDEEHEKEVDESTNAMDEEAESLSQIYQKIKSNKAANPPLEMDSAEEEVLDDPGFRMYYVDPETRKEYEVPPYTSPGDMVELVAELKAIESLSTVSTSNENVAPSKDKQNEVDSIQQEEYSERTFDGYTAIQDANSRSSRDEELKAMRSARQKNRFLNSVDDSKVGARRMNDVEK